MFKDSLFDFIDIINPIQAQSFQKKSLGMVVKRFPFLKDSITLQLLDNEWRTHALLNFKDLNLNADDPVDIYWSKVFNLKNAAGNDIFSNLKIVINLLLILPFSNASVERIFSQMNDTKTSIRNSLNTETLAALLHTKQGVKCDDGLLKFELSDLMLRTNIWDSINNKT